MVKNDQIALAATGQIHRLVAASKCNSIRKLRTFRFGAGNHETERRGADDCWGVTIAKDDLQSPAPVS